MMYFQVLVQLLVRSCTFGSLNGGHVIWALYDAVLAQQLRLARQAAGLECSSCSERHGHKWNLQVQLCMVP